MDELQSVGVGVALGLVVVSFLTLYPGQPFDYTTDCDDACTSKCISPTKTEDVPAQSNTLTEGEVNGIHGQHQQRIAEIERAAQRVKIQKLQELLGLEKETAQQLVDRAKEKAKDAVKAPGWSRSSSYSTSSNGVWLDRSFFTVMFGLLAWVLWQDYSINLFSVAAHMLPREAEVVRQVAAVPRDLLSQIFELWK